MTSFPESLKEYQKQLALGQIKQAYTGLMKYFDDLKACLKTKYPDYIITDIHYGLMDFTYFYFTPKKLKQKNLKIVILFIHETFTFEVWLCGYNKNVQTKYLKLFAENNWNKYPTAKTTKGVDYIAKYTLASNPDFGDLDALTQMLETKTLDFIGTIEGWICK